MSELVARDGDLATLDDNPNGSFDPHLNRLCNCVERLNRTHGL